VWGGRANLRACTALAAAGLLLAAGGCGGGERRDAGAAAGPFSVDIVRAQFPARQHLADKPELVMTVRNAGEETIPDLAVTVHGFSARTGDSAQADARELVWLIDDEPSGAVTAIEDTWTAGALAPGASTTLRWHVTPVRAGTHELTYAVAGDVAGPGATSLARGGPARGSLIVRVAGAPAQARVDPRTGEVIRE